jgi:hypothetical protein
MDEQAAAETTGKRRRPLRLGVAAGVVAAIAIGGIGFAYAQTTSTGSSTSTSTPSGSAPPSSVAPGQGGKPGPRGPRGGPGPFIGIGPGRGAIHGEYVIKSGSGYVTVDTQIGTVTAVSTTSITVKSEDNFSKTYVVTADTAVDAQRDGIGSVKTGDTVNVTGKVDGSTVTATSIDDASLQRSSHQGFYPPPASPSTTQA